MRRLAPLGLLLAVALAGPARAAPKIEEFASVPTANAGLQDIVQGPDGNVWFTERNANKIGRISGSNPGATTEFDVPAGTTSPDLITVGPDGNLWFTLGTSVGRMPPGNPAGAVAFGGMGIIQARGIARGPDGNLWVSDAGGNQVHRITPAGTAASMPIPLPLGVNARGIARGPDGNMWVADFSTPGGVVRVTPGGMATRFPVPAGSPIDVIGGGDGNIWYAGQGTAVGKVTPAGVATAFVSKGVDPFGIARGPDSEIWFAEFQANAVGRVEHTGETSHVTGMTGTAGPRYVATGPGNTVWFTEETGNRVGRVTGIGVGGGGGGGGGGTGGGTGDTTRPKLSRVKLSARRLRAGKTLKIRFRLSEQAAVLLSFERVTRGLRVGGRCVKAKRSNRGRRSCKRYVELKSAGRNYVGAAGQATIRVRVRLKAGSYRLGLRARDSSGNRSKRFAARIVVLPRER